MFKNHALKLGLLATAVFGVTLAACSKDDGPSARNKKYALVAAGGASADITATENADSSFNLKITLTKTTKDTTYFFNVIKGSIGTPTTDTLFKFSPFKSTATGSTISATLSNIKTLNGTKFTFDSLVKRPAFAIISFKKAAGTDSVAAKANMYQAQ